MNSTCLLPRGFGNDGLLMWRAGSYAGSVGLYSCAEGERLALLKASKGGVSQVPHPQIL
eukprot:COSAG04_NODE_19483_length_415_cov_1.107595_2_plen_58_part_01